MKVCICGRDVFYKLLAVYFKKVIKNLIACEIGVLRGDNAQKIYQEMNPSLFFLIDKWAPHEADERENIYFKEFLSGDAEYNRKVDNYFGGDIKEQMTFDNLYKGVKEKFDKKDNIVTVCAAGIRAESAKKFFESRGYNVANGGRWTNLKDLS